MSELVEIGNVRVLTIAQEGEVLQKAADIGDLIGEAFFCGAELVAIPVERLGPDFLRLKTGIAGEVFQKFVNYRLKCAIVGDIGEALAESRSLRDFVYETNKGGSIWFVPDFDGLRAKLESLQSGS